ncbi:rhomboid family intramembrane serine protease [Anianabacter salinae]|uniref:rhomboid family intramembrane serine protease n=1 Tax=Anianabacter salinae TaxID=2851023 RepID=UPI00225DD2E6|nr:rhomboid family intramembrane serine protease [Anianabacter salinae]MBV0913964.1 rhomboid family intramembrane serine protease [Anianabacter salinae]
MSNPYTESPVNPLPPVVIVLALAMVLPEIVFQLGTRGLVGGPQAVGWRLDAIERFAFSGDILDWMLANGRWPPEQVVRFVSYPFVHASATHMIFVLVFLVALGKMVAETFGALAVVAVFFGSAILGALVYTLVLNDPLPLIGGYPAVYGLIGAFTFTLWARLGAAGENQLRAFTLIALLLGIQLVFGFLFGAGNDWVADMAGFAAGFGLSFVVAPGGWARIVQRLRRR